MSAVAFEIAATELRELGITLIRLPGEYAVNFRHGSEATTRIFETLDEAFAGGRVMAAERAAADSHSAGPRRRCRPRRMTPNAHNKRLRLAHMRRLRARALRQQPAVIRQTTTNEARDCLPFPFDDEVPARDFE